jgi:ABC-type sugar transport system ATPase subunit
MSAETGRVHAIVGENGAGKSTLVKIMSGVVQPDEGLILRAGAPTTFPSPTDATQAGIHLVHQELALLPDRTVVENVWLGQELRTRFGTLDWRTMQRRTREALQWLNLRVDVDRRVGTLNTGIRQFVEIARALVRDPPRHCRPTRPRICSPSWPTSAPGGRRSSTSAIGSWRSSDSRTMSPS